MTLNLAEDCSLLNRKIAPVSMCLKHIHGWKKEGFSEIRPTPVYWEKMEYWSSREMGKSSTLQHPSTPTLLNKAAEGHVLSLDHIL